MPSHSSSPRHSSSRASRALSRHGAQPRQRAHAHAVSALALGALVVSSPGIAQAHLRLIDPPSWVVEGALGDPQKTSPCGGTQVTETGVVTTFRAGEEITVAWQETVPHPGHFRISLARDRADLIDPPVETTNGDGVSGTSISAEIMDTPRYPVLVDNLFPRSLVITPDAFTTTVTLPDETCDSCTLQLIQFMAQHGPGYFYYHCANVRIVAADADLPEEDGATGAAGAASSGTGSSSSTGGVAGSEPVGAGVPAATSSAETGASIGQVGAAGASATSSSAGASAASTTPSGAPSSSTPAGSLSDDDDDDDGGCALASRNAAGTGQAGIGRVLLCLLTLLGVASLRRGAADRSLCGRSST
jgi:hypothetical protein